MCYMYHTHRCFLLIALTLAETQTGDTSGPDPSDELEAAIEAWAARVASSLCAPRPSWAATCGKEMPAFWTNPSMRRDRTGCRSRALGSRPDVASMERRKVMRSNGLRATSSMPSIELRMAARAMREGVADRRAGIPMASSVWKRLKSRRVASTAGWLAASVSCRPTARKCWTNSSGVGPATRQSSASRMSISMLAISAVV
mmetsp:Transcript_25321/g.73284  ORF Transcript_25321/g.73284 Transcript_25321/m.73284 type:complete len:201 (+) Transcript_25321:526-1128(+)